MQRLERDVKGAIIELRDAIDNKSGDTTHNIQEFLAELRGEGRSAARAAALDRQRLDAIEKAVSTGAPLDQYANPKWPLTGYGRDTAE